MNVINDIVCDRLGVESKSPIREGGHSEKHSLWSFWSQVFFVLVVAAMSALLPWLGIVSSKTH
jgi:hypothetical protein